MLVCPPSPERAAGLDRHTQPIAPPVSHPRLRGASQGPERAERPLLPSSPAGSPGPSPASTQQRDHHPWLWWDSENHRPKVQIAWSASASSLPVHIVNFYTPHLACTEDSNSPSRSRASPKRNSSRLLFSLFSSPVVVLRNPERDWRETQSRSQREGVLVGPQEAVALIQECVPCQPHPVGVACMRPPSVRTAHTHGTQPALLPYGCTPPAPRAEPATLRSRTCQEAQDVGEYPHPHSPPPTLVSRCGTHQPYQSTTSRLLGSWFLFADLASTLLQFPFTSTASNLRPDPRYLEPESWRAAPRSLSFAIWALFRQHIPRRSRRARRRRSHADDHKIILCGQDGFPARFHTPSIIRLPA